MRVAHHPAPPKAPDIEQTSYQDEQPDAPLPDPSEAPSTQSDEAVEPALELPPLIDPQPESPQREAEPIPAPLPTGAPSLEQLRESVRLHFPLIRQAVAARTIASGEVLSATGSFDHKLEGYSNSQPLDFYKNYRQQMEVKRDTYWGGEVYAGYRIGRGEFEPWYQERQTNEGGEFNAGFVMPLAQDRGIDANRAELWRAQLERGRVEPEILAMIIGSVRDANVAYWQWVATAANFRVAEDILQLGLDRTDYLKRQVELGEKAEIDLVDNQRIIVTRRAKLVDARRKLEQASVKLSLFLRDDNGMPIVLPVEVATVAFPDTLAAEAWGASANVALAEANRPELAELQFAQQQLAILLRQARNETRPKVDAGLFVSQDVGEPTSAKRDKSQMKLEATLAVEVPLERRKALGKVRQLRGKIAQIRAKTQFAADKIAYEAQLAHTALTAAAERVVQTTEGVELAERMRAATQRRYELGQDTLFNLNLREQQTAEAAIDRVAALYDYQVALAEYAAALGFESVAELSATDPTLEATQQP